MEKHSFDQTPFLTVAFTVDCQNTTKSIWKEFSPHPTRVQQEPIFASKFKCIKIKFLSSKVSFWSTWVFQEDVFHSSIYSYNPILTHFFLQRPTFDPLPRTSERNGSEVYQKRFSFINSHWENIFCGQFSVSKCKSIKF